jgi:quinol---cytochrome c reductase iron-sulfur subunit, bacillus type
VSSDQEKTHLPAPTVWPIGFAIGLAVLLVGLVVSWPAVAVGGAITLIFGILWVRDLSKGHSDAETPTPPAKAAAAPAVAADASGETTYPRNKFLEASTLGLGALIGGLVTIPPLGMLAASSFEGQKFHPLDLGPLTDYPEGQFMITTFVEDPEAGEVSRRTAYIRNNGTFDRGKYKGQPSFTVLSNRCAHLGCPVQPNGPVADKAARVVTDRIGIETLKLTPAKPAGFGCPCHGGQYDTEGNRTAGPPVRALDRFNFSIVNGHLILGSAYSVDKVRGEGKDARIKKYPLHNPGQHVSGPEAWLWPIPEIRA